MAFVDDLVDRVISREGGPKVVQNPVDPGGLTKFGISQRAFPDLDIRNLTFAQARDVYKTEYYLKNHIDQLPEAIQESVLDFCVHSGPQIAILTLQKLSNCKQDGTIGAETRTAVAKLPQDQLLRAYNRERIGYLIRQVQSDGKKIIFLSGWIFRVLSLLP